MRTIVLYLQKVVLKVKIDPENLNKLNTKHQIINPPGDRRKGLFSFQRIL